MSDPTRPNHFFHDSLGDPATCPGDHNHPKPEPADSRFAGLPDDVIENAKKAICSRCKVQVVESKALLGTVFLQLYVPALGVRKRLFLCGACGIAAREFLHPEIADDPAFQMVKAELLSRFL